MGSHRPRLSGRAAHLNPGLRQVDLDGHLLAHEDVRVARLAEQVLQHVQLLAGEGGPLPALLAAVAVAAGWKRRNVRSNPDSGSVLRGPGGRPFGEISKRF